MARAILFDSTQCVGCKACEEACATKWGNSYDEKVAAEERVSSHKLTALRTFGEHYSRKLCMHCLEPSCASVCPVGALQKTALGPVVYDESKCMGCRYCMVACPFQVPSYEWDSRLPRVKKCDGCFERQSKGQPTACTEACPTGATIGGEREELIAEARKRIAGNPGQYYNHIYGLEEVGGTSVLMLSAVPFEQIGMPGGLPKDALPERTWAVLSHIPDVAGLGAVLLGGVYWITHRRDEVAKAERAEAGKEKENVR